LQGLEPEKFEELRQRVADGLESTFASSYTREVSLREALQPDAYAVYSRQATGEKFLIAPHKE
jgi:hypothetical protein